MGSVSCHSQRKVAEFNRVTCRHFPGESKGTEGRTVSYESVHTKSAQILAFKCRYGRGEEEDEEQGSNS